jgi:plasmid stabilization system protein ParE
LIWTLRARADLAAIVRHIARDNSRAAFDVGENILRHAKVLESFPLIGPLFRNTALPQIRRIVCGEYLIVYRCKPAARELEILTIWHAARGHPDFL